MAKTLKTTWELWNYDVWGNDEEGFFVNDRFCFNREYEINLKIEKNNPDTSQEFLSAFPSDYQIKKAFDFWGNISVDGDDTIIYVNREKNDYPLGEMILTSHKSLSPIGE